MRPVNKGLGNGPYSKYQDAIGDLEKTLGEYCSYCEERFSAALEVEHVSPKSKGGALLDWDNFLLACKTCNTAKKAQPASISTSLWPDKDNTIKAFSYSKGGFISVATPLDATVASLAAELIRLVKLDRHLSTPGKKPTKRDKRYKQREERWTLAEGVKKDYEAVVRTYPKEALQAVLNAALGYGFFSVWMAVFHDMPVVRNALIEAFKGTATDCFDVNSSPITRRDGRI